jgi:hypothetical protein
MNVGRLLPHRQRRHQLVGVELRANRVGGKRRRGVHPVAGCCPVAETIHLQLEQVAVRVGVVERDRHAVIEREGRHDAVALQPNIRGQQIGERSVLECVVVQARVPLLVRIINGARPDHQRQALVGRIIGQKGPTGECEGRREAQHQAVPVDHRLQARGRQVDVVQLWPDDGLVGHGWFTLE